MFDLGWSEIALVVALAFVVLGRSISLRLSGLYTALCGSVAAFMGVGVPILMPPFMIWNFRRGRILRSVF